ncbi:MAG: hypothetical protein J0M07_09685 [Anaerolineae bacterium]|nr:hypothetical protein [Anaerolineae bacterium]
MARRRSSNRSSSSTNRGYQGRRKSENEARVERFTWALLVLAFAVTQLLPEGSFPNWFIPLSGAVILLGSAFYQYTRGWRVGPITWIGGAVEGLLAYYVMRVNPAADMLGESLLVFVAVILFGLITGET